MQKLSFKPFNKFSQGTIYRLLLSSYAPYPELIKQDKESWKNYDKEVFENLDKGIGQSGFVTCLDDEPIGFASWDPRHKPIAIIGHNCIIPQFQRKGYGKAQIKEALKRLKKQNFKTVQVSTGGGDFFLASRKMYESCDFIEIKREMHKKKPDFEVVYFEKILNKV